MLTKSAVVQPFTPSAPTLWAYNIYNTSTTQGTRYYYNRYSDNKNHSLIELECTSTQLTTTGTITVDGKTLIRTIEFPNNYCEYLRSITATRGYQSVPTVVDSYETWASHLENSHDQISVTIPEKHEIIQEMMIFQPIVSSEIYKIYKIINTGSTLICIGASGPYIVIAATDDNVNWGMCTYIEDSSVTEFFDFDAIDECNWAYLTYGGHEDHKSGYYTLCANCSISWGFIAAYPSNGVISLSPIENERFRCYVAMGDDPCVIDVDLGTGKGTVYNLNFEPTTDGSEEYVESVAQVHSLGTRGGFWVCHVASYMGRPMRTAAICTLEYSMFEISPKDTALSMRFNAMMFSQDTLISSRIMYDPSVGTRWAVLAHHTGDSQSRYIRISQNLCEISDFDTVVSEETIDLPVGGWNDFTLQREPKLYVIDSTSSQSELLYRIYASDGQVRGDFISSDIGANWLLCQNREVTSQEMALLRIVNDDKQLSRVQYVPSHDVTETYSYPFHLSENKAYTTHGDIPNVHGLGSLVRTKGNIDRYRVIDRATGRHVKDSFASTVEATQTATKYPIAINAEFGR